MCSGGKLTDTFLGSFFPPTRAFCFIDMKILKTFIREDVEGSRARLAEDPKGWHAGKIRSPLQWLLVHCTVRPSAFGVVPLFSVSSLSPSLTCSTPLLASAVLKGFYYLLDLNSDPAQNKKGFHYGVEKTERWRLGRVGGKSGWGHRICDRGRG